MTKAELAEIRALLIAQDALDAARSRGLIDRLQQLFRPPRREASASDVAASEGDTPLEDLLVDEPDASLFEAPAEIEPLEPPRRQFGRRDDEPLELVTPVDEPAAAAVVAPTFGFSTRPVFVPDEWPSRAAPTIEDEGAPYHPDDLLDDSDWPDQALFETTIADWEETLPAADDQPIGARALLLRLEAILRIEREALERRLGLKAA